MSGPNYQSNTAATGSNQQQLSPRELEEMANNAKTPKTQVRRPAAAAVKANKPINPNSRKKIDFYRLDPRLMRDAIILSEIIGKPVSTRNALRE